MVTTLPNNLFITGLVVLIADFFRDPSQDRLVTSLIIAALAALVGIGVAAVARTQRKEVIRESEHDLASLDPMDKDFEVLSSRIIAKFEKKLLSEWSPGQHGHASAGIVALIAVLIGVFGYGGLIAAVLLAVVWSRQ